MTTPSGKPPHDAPNLDKSWGSRGDGSPEGPDSSNDPPTPRQVGPRVEAPEEAEEAPIYGAGVPYGGDERTEEIEPIALDMPFTPEERRTPIARAVTSRKPAEPARDYELKVPVAQLMLSDLFDSVPSSASLAPPDPW